LCGRAPVAQQKDLKISLDWAIDDGLLRSRNPVGRTKFPPPQHTSHTYQTTAEVAAFAQACGAHGDVVALLSGTDLTFGELVDLGVQVVDLAWRSITQVGGKLIEGSPKSAAGRRSVPYRSESCRSSSGVSAGASRASRPPPHPTML
jgi:integrase